MSRPSPAISVVVATHNRPARLRRLLAALNGQTVESSDFELVLVDDGSARETAAVVETFQPRFNLQAIRRERAGGAAVAREEGWLRARGELVAFTDDDCEPDPDWIQRCLEAAKANPGAFIQGATRPADEELDRLGVYTRTIDVPEQDVNFHTCNILYPRELLERVGGFETEIFDGVGGEDCDLGWKAMAAGADAVFEPRMRVQHAVNELGPIGMLRVAARWGPAVRNFVVYPELRRRVFYRGVFWKREHFLLFVALAGVATTGRLRPLGVLGSLPYVRSAWGRARTRNGGVPAMAFYVLHDAVEIGTVARAGIRYGRLLL